MISCLSSFSRPEYKLTYVYLYIKKLPGADKTAIREAVGPEHDSRSPAVRPAGNVLCGQRLVYECGSAI